MLALIAIILMAFWFVGFVFHIAEGAIHLLLLGAVVMFILHVL